MPFDNIDNAQFSSSDVTVNNSAAVLADMNTNLVGVISVLSDINQTSSIMNTNLVGIISALSDINQTLSILITVITNDIVPTLNQIVTNTDVLNQVLTTEDTQKVLNVITNPNSGSDVDPIVTIAAG